MMEIIMLSGKEKFLLFKSRKMGQNFHRFERNGPNSTLQVDDHKKIINTPDGEMMRRKMFF